MGTFLCSPVWVTPPDFRVFRQYVDWYVLGWTPSNIVQLGRENIFEETVFGGYKTYLTFNQRFWNWNSGSWRFADIFEDYYVTPPGSSTPISAGTTRFQITPVNPYFRVSVLIDPAGFPYTQYRYMDLPPGDPDFWYQNGTPAPARPFAIPP